MILKIEQLAKHHHKADFDCGNDPLNRYLAQYANQHSKKGLSKTYVLIDDNHPHQILGFYSVSANALEASDIQGYPSDIKLPCLLLGRLAVAKHIAGQGLASYLLAHLFALTKRLADEIGIAIIMVDLKHLGLVGLYQRYGFRQISPDSLTMYLKVNDIA